MQIAVAFLVVVGTVLLAWGIAAAISSLAVAGVIILGGGILSGKYLSK
ncbi:MAG: hypothetical protein JW712_04500 [Dehalococcoidales bacterium]|nr:hypothetical protein [Dehalococcoidales bacterium]